MYHYVRLCILQLLIVSIYNKYVSTEGPDQMGKEFVLSFWYMNPGDVTEHMQPAIYITTLSNTPVFVDISTPRIAKTSKPYVKQSEVVVRGRSVKVQLPLKLRTRDATMIYDKVLYVNASDEIAIQAINMEDFNADAYTAYPIDALGSTYYLVSLSANGAFQIIAADIGQTTVTINVKGDGFSYGGSTYQEGDDLTVSLEQFQVFSLSDTAGTAGDLTTTKIHADKPIAVISGNVVAKVGDETQVQDTYDTVMAQMLPLTNWGTEYVLVPTPYRTVGEVYKVVSYLDGTQIQLTNEQDIILNRDEYREIKFSSGNEYKVLKSTNPVLVYKYSPSLGKGGEPKGGDPAMSYMPAISQWTNQYVFSKIDGHIEVDHGAYNDFTVYMTIVIKESEKGGLRWNGQPLGQTVVWDALPTTPVPLGFVGTHIQIGQGAQDLYHIDPIVTFLVMTNGLASNAMAYAALAGSRAAVINDASCVNTSSVAADIVDNDCDGRIDEENYNGIDDDGDGLIDEDLTYVARVDGNWGSWNNTCENCTTIRTRDCDDPAPQGYGAPCNGVNSEIVDQLCGDCTTAAWWDIDATTISTQPGTSPTSKEQATNFDTSGDSDDIDTTVTTTWTNNPTTIHSDIKTDYEIMHTTVLTSKVASSAFPDTSTTRAFDTTQHILSSSTAQEQNATNENQTLYPTAKTSTELGISGTTNVIKLDTVNTTNPNTDPPVTAKIETTISHKFSTHSEDTPGTVTILKSTTPVMSTDITERNEISSTSWYETTANITTAMDSITTKSDGNSRAENSQENYENSQETQTDISKGLSSFVGGSVGGVVFVAIAAGMIIAAFRYKQRKSRVGDSTTRLQDDVENDITIEDMEDDDIRDADQIYTTLEDQ